MVILQKVNRWFYMCLKLIKESWKLQLIIWGYLLLKYLPDIISAIKH